MGCEPDAWAILFCDDLEMRIYQKKFRKLDRTTDVLSFPAFERSGLNELYSKLPKGQRSLGDVVISMPAVVRGAKRARRPVAAELVEVLIHAYLHLLGFDHVVGAGVGAKDAREMKALQKALFKMIFPQLS